MFFRSKKSVEKAKRDQALELMMLESQATLLEAAKGTADAAKSLTNKLRNRLEDSIRQFESTARILNDALFLTDLEGRIQSFNPAAGRLFGRTELQGLFIGDLFVYGGDPIEDASFLWSLAEHTSAWLPSSEKQLRGLRPDGVQVWIEPSITRLDWSSGASSILMIVRNQEPLVGLSESARAARSQYKSVFEASYDGIVIQQHGRIVAANPSVKRMFGYGSEILDRPVDCLFEGEPDLTEREQRCLMGVDADGDKHPVLVTVSDFVWGGEPAGLITVKEA